MSVGFFAARGEKLRYPRWKCKSFHSETFADKFLEFLSLSPSFFVQFMPRDFKLCPFLLISWPGWYSLVDVAHRFLLELIFVIFHFVQWSCSLGGTIPWGDWSVFSWTMLHRVPHAPYFTSIQLPVILNELKPRSCNDAALLDSPVCRGIEF